MNWRIESYRPWVAIMERPDETSNNQRKLDGLMKTLSEALDQALEKGFFGKVAIELPIQDGSIQYTVCRVERTQK